MIASVLEMAWPRARRSLRCVRVACLAHEPQRSVVQHDDELERRARFRLDATIGLGGAAGSDHGLCLHGLAVFGLRLQSSISL